MPITKRTIPPFTLTNSTEVVVIRPGKVTMEKGRRVEGKPTSHIIQANVQPLGYKELQLLTEADKTKEWYKAYMDIHQDIRGDREGDDGWEADYIVWNDDTYKVMKIHKYQMGVLDHIVIHVARTPLVGGWPDVQGEVED